MKTQNTNSDTEVKVLASIIDRLEPSVNEITKYLLDPKDGMIVAYVNLENRVRVLERWVKVSCTLFLIIFGALVSYLFGWLPKPGGVTP